MEVKKDKKLERNLLEPKTSQKFATHNKTITKETEENNQQPKGDWKMTVEEFSFAGCHYNSSCD